MNGEMHHLCQGFTTWTWGDRVAINNKWIKNDKRSFDWLAQRRWI